jgi:hypothetical protein
MLYFYSTNHNFISLGGKPYTYKIWQLNNQTDDAQQLATVVNWCVFYQVTTRFSNFIMSKGQYSVCFVAAPSAFFISQKHG